MQDRYQNFTPIQIDDVVDSAAASLRSTLDTVAPLKKKTVKQRRIAPWFNAQTRALKQTSRRLERKWRSNSLDDSHLIRLLPSEKKFTSFFPLMAHGPVL